MFINPSRARRRKRRNAPKPWASLYAKKYGSLSKRKKAKRKSRKAKRKHAIPAGMKRVSHAAFAKKLKARKPKSSNPKHVILSRKDLNTMLLNRNPRRRRRGKRHNPRRRRNAGIAPFIQANPRRRSLARRRKNPSFAIPSVNTIMRKSITYSGGAALGVGMNLFALNKIDNHWLRNGARILTACIGAPMLGGELGAAASGALFAPLVSEIAVFFKIPGIATEADLEADLQDLLDDMSSRSDASRGFQVDADLW